MRTRRMTKEQGERCNISRFPNFNKSVFKKSLLCRITFHIQPKLLSNSYFYYSVNALLENAVCLFDLREGEAMGNEWGSIDFTFTD